VSIIPHIVRKTIRPRNASLVPGFEEMPRYYFDFRDDAGLTFDDTGEELPDLDAARDAALRALAEAIRAKSDVGAEMGQMFVEVRTHAAAVLTVSASVEVILKS